MVLYNSGNKNAKKHTCFNCTVKRPLRSLNETFLVGGFNPFEKYESKWESSPIFGVKIKNI